jgi:hypothetical protein
MRGNSLPTSVNDKAPSNSGFARDSFHDRSESVVLGNVSKGPSVSPQNLCRIYRQKALCRSCLSVAPRQPTSW